ncbi:FkbM family methyltransferase [Methylobacterium tarhaniae]|uniref:FkbM family methyltransferase n=1 Tax=Methylobacterium tarhaniae TaxID=1187852 RepID=UPI0009F95D8A|nr:FkbM family methyltransferase [Methylobacterium tarhaniae]
MTCNKIKIVNIGDHQIQLDISTKHGRIYYTNFNDGIDDVDVAIAKQFMREGDTALDLGANIGYNAIHYLSLGAVHVDAVELHPDLNARLRLFESNRFTVHPVAIGAAPGRARLALSQTHNQGHTLKSEVIHIHRPVFGEVIQEIEVNVTTIDTLFPAKKFDYIKVDIEGSELDFIKGARRLLAERLPRILQIEIMPEFYEESYKELRQYFKKILRIDYDRESGRINAVDPSTRPQEKFRNIPPNYILFN